MDKKPNKKTGPKAPEKATQTASDYTGGDYACPFCRSTNLGSACEACRGTGRVRFVIRGDQVLAQPAG